MISILFPQLHLESGSGLSQWKGNIEGELGLEGICKSGLEAVSKHPVRIDERNNTISLSVVFALRKAEFWGLAVVEETF